MLKKQLLFSFSMFCVKEFLSYGGMASNALMVKILHWRYKNWSYKDTLKIQKKEYYIIIPSIEFLFH